MSFPLFQAQPKCTLTSETSLLPPNTQQLFSVYIVHSTNSTKFSNELKVKCLSYLYFFNVSIIEFEAFKVSTNNI